MDLLHFLTQRLRFIQNLYDSAIRPFEETKRQIDAGEAPYVDESDPKDYDGEPRFLAEWQAAEDAIMVVGHWCLCMVQATLQTYLRDCVSPLGVLWWDSSELKTQLSQKRGNWFERYRLLFLDDLYIDWNTGPVPLADLEQLNLTRDDLIHNIDMGTFSVERVDKHAERFPTGLFIDDLWRGSVVERVRIEKDKLALAIRLVTEFCTWLDSIRCEYPRYVDAMLAGEPWTPRADDPVASSGVPVVPVGQPPLIKQSL